MQHVIVASSNSAQRRRLSDMVSDLPDFHLVAQTRELMDTYTEVEHRIPKAVLISEDLATLPEFEVMRGLFASLDVRWLVMSNRQAPDLTARTGEAIGSDLFQVPDDATPIDLATQLRALTRTARLVPPVTTAPRSTQGPLPGLILIGASTGGVDALLIVLRQFPVHCPPTLIVQHTGVGFGASLGNLLDRQSPPNVQLAQDGMSLRAGTVAIAAGTKSHVEFHDQPDHRLRFKEGEPVCGHMPSIDVTFQSARRFSKHTSAAILTGMGRDGAAGLKMLRDAGAYTVAQDRASSVVYGMPKAAVELDAAQDVKPINAIGQALLTPARASMTI